VAIVSKATAESLIHAAAEWSIDALMNEFNNFPHSDNVSYASSLFNEMKLLEKQLNLKSLNDATEDDLEKLVRYFSVGKKVIIGFLEMKTEKPNEYLIIMITRDYSNKKSFRCTLKYIDQEIEVVNVVEKGENAFTNDTHFLPYQIPYQNELTQTLPLLNDGVITIDELLSKFSDIKKMCLKKLQVDDEL
jgi:hypothetical protein